MFESSIAKFTFDDISLKNSIKKKTHKLKKVYIIDNKNGFEICSNCNEEIYLESNLDQFYQCIIHFNCTSKKCKLCFENNLPAQELSLNNKVNVIKSPRSKSPLSKTKSSKSPTNSRTKINDLSLPTNFKSSNNYNVSLNSSRLSTSSNTKTNQSSNINIANTNKQIQTFKQQIAEYENLIEEIESQYQDLESTVKDKDLHIEYLTRSLEDKQRQINSLNEHFKEYNNNAKNKENEIKFNQKNEILELSSQIKKYKHQNENLHHENTDLKIKYNSSLNQIENLKQLLKDKDCMLNNQMNLLNNFTTNHQNSNNQRNLMSSNEQFISYNNNLNHLCNGNNQPQFVPINLNQQNFNNMNHQQNFNNMNHQQNFNNMNHQQNFNNMNHQQNFNNMNHQQANDDNLMQNNQNLNNQNQNTYINNNQIENLPSRTNNNIINLSSLVLNTDNSIPNQNYPKQSATDNISCNEDIIETAFSNAETNEYNLSKSNYNIGGCESIKSSTSFDIDNTGNQGVDQSKESGIIDVDKDGDEKEDKQIGGKLNSDIGLSAQKQVEIRDDIDIKNSQQINQNWENKNRLETSEETFNNDNYINDKFDQELQNSDSNIQIIKSSENQNDINQSPLNNYNPNNELLSYSECIKTSSINNFEIDDIPIESSNFEIPEFQDQEIQLVSCSICNRSFNINSINKHEKICKKVFVDKRKKFDTVTHRKTDELNQLDQNDNHKVIVNNSKSKIKKMSKKSINIVNTDMNDNNSSIEQVPLWKKNSDQLRNAMKGGRDPNFEAEVIDDRIPCPVCNRKFAEESYLRHQNICSKKSKK